MIRFSLVVVTLLALGQSLIANAHSGLARSVPAKGAALAQSPAQLELGFSGEVRLMSLRVTNTAGDEVKLEQSRSLTPAQQFGLPLPSLQPGDYVVHWMVMGGDSHKMSGDFTFSVTGQDALAQP